MSGNFNQYSSSTNETSRISKSLDIPFRFQRDKSYSGIKLDNENPTGMIECTMYDISKSNFNYIGEPNDNMIFPTIASDKLRNYYLQINNNCKTCNKHILSFDETQNELQISKSNSKNQNKISNYLSSEVWNLKESRVNSITKISKAKAKFEKFQELSNNKEILLMPNQFFKAEAILHKEFEEYRLPIKNTSIPRKAMTTVSHSKPPLSPFTTNSNGSLRNCKTLMNSKKIECTINKSIISKNEGYEIDSSLSDDRCLEINDLESFDNSLEGEMDLLDNLDSEIPNENSSKLAYIEDLRSDSESPTEDMLKEVHRLVNDDLLNSQSSNQPKAPFINSLFPNIPPVIRFVREGEAVSAISASYRSMMKWRYSAITPNVVKRAVKRSGFKLTSKPGFKWIGYFGSHMKPSGFKTINEHQKINHMPGSFQIGRKDRLWRNVTALSSKKSKNQEFNFLPKTYCLPSDLKLLKGIWDDDESRKKAKWILKPPASARGIGVRVISKWSQIPKKRAALIQSYVSRPFLINDSKFDLRVYVAVTSCDPLRIYVYREGLVRFASHKYSKSSKNMSNRFIHLTNYSVNKKNSSYQSNEDHNKCQGHKWTLQTLWRHFEQDLNIDWKPIWKNIKDCVVKTIIAVESHINSNIKMYCTHKSCVYELFGFDVLLDHNLKPWVLEVNVSPSLHSNSPLDIEVKSSLIADLFNLVGFQLFQAPEEPIPLAYLSNHRPSLSASSIPVTVSKSIVTTNSTGSSPDKTLSKSFRKQASLTNISKTKLRKTSSSKSLKQTRGSDIQSSVSDENEFPFNNNSNEYLSQNKKKLSNSQTNSELLGVDPLNLQQRGYFNRVLTSNEKSKHKFYIQKICYDNPSVLKTITDKLTVDDTRILIESVDEFNRSGNFELVFPVISNEIDTYLSYINISSGSRYYNSLLVEFMKKYSAVNDKFVNDCNPISKIINSNGLQLLEKQSKFLYSNSSLDSFWNPPICKDLNRTKLNIRSSSAESSNTTFK